MDRKHNISLAWIQRNVGIIGNEEAKETGIIVFEICPPIIRQRSSKFN